MDKYIKLSDAITTLHQIENLYRQTMVSSVRSDVTAHCCKAVQAIPAADVVEVWHGEWILSVYTVDIPDTRRWHEWHCSNCGYVRKAGWENTEDGRKPDAKYCEHCMAKMGGGAQ